MGSARQETDSPPHCSTPIDVTQSFLRPKSSDTRGNAIFPYTYSTMLRSAGRDIMVQQELLRHANIQTTMNIYTDGLGPEACREQTGCGDRAFGREK